MAPTYRTFFDLPPVSLSSAAAAVALASRRPGARGDGPSRILKASAYVELYDEELKYQAAERGIHTLSRRLQVGGDGASLGRLLSSAAFPVVIGDGPDASAWVMTSVRRLHPEASLILISGKMPTAEFINALAGSHGNASLCLIGLKSPPQDPPPNLIVAASARELRRGIADAPWPNTGPIAHLSVQADVLEPAFLPGTNVTEPGGLGWWDMMTLLKTLLRHHQVISADVAGHQPLTSLVVADFTLAKLVYKIISYRLVPV